MSNDRRSPSARSRAASRASAIPSPNAPPTLPSGRFVNEVLYAHPEGGWQIVLAASPDRYPVEEFRDHPVVTALCADVPTVYVLEAIGGGPFKTWPIGQFGTYLRCTPWRPYQNPWIECLYWFHEMRHLRSWRIGGDCEPPIMRGERESWYAWSKRAIESELEASVWSEVMAQLLIPGVRENSFAHPIWADRFLDDKRLMRNVRSGRMSVDALFAHVAKERLRVLEHGGRFNDYVEKQIGGYYRTNLDWVARYARETVGFGPYANTPAFRCVEEHLPDVHDIDKHVRWLHDVTPTRDDLIELGRRHPGFTPQFQVPLGCQAFTFTEVFARYFEENGNDVFFR